MTIEEKIYNAGVTRSVKIATVHSAITADATSDAISTIGAKGIGIVLTEGGTVNNKSGVLTITVSADGTNFYDYSMLIDNTANTSSETLTRVASKTRATAGTDLLWFTPETLGGVNYLKAKVDITDGGSPTGNFTVKVIVSN